MIRSATVIRRSSEPNPPEQFQQWLDRVARPIEFATRDAFAHLPTVKNLNRFVSSQVMQALSDRVYPRAIEAALLQLRELFLEDQQRLPAEDQQRRLQEATVILGVLRKAVRDPARAWQEPEPIVVRESVMNETPSRAWWEQPIRFAKGVGPKRTALLQRFGIETVEDALWTLPWRYEDRSVMTPIGQLVPGVQASICGTIVRSEAKRARNRRLTILDIVVEDATGRLQAVFFNQPFLEPLFTVGTSDHADRADGGRRAGVGGDEDGGCAIRSGGRGIRSAAARGAYRSGVPRNQGVDVSADARAHERLAGCACRRGAGGVAGSASCPLSIAAHSTSHSGCAFSSGRDGWGTARSWPHAGASPLGVRRAVCAPTRIGLAATSR